MTPLTLLRAAACLGSLTLASTAQSPDDIWTGTFANDAMGTVVATLGDCNGDGVDDIAYASPHADRQIFFPIPFVLSNVGRVQVRSGATGALLHDWFGVVGGAEFGYAVSNAGDVNGDGRDDVLIGIPLADGPLGDEGQVQVRSGATGDLLRLHNGPQPFARFGHSVAGGVRLDLDFTDDYVVGAPLYDINDSIGGFDQEGAVVRYDGNSGFPVVTYEGADINGPAVPFVTKVNRPRHYGWSVAVAEHRVVIGAPRSDVALVIVGETLELTGLVHAIHVLSSGEVVEDGNAGARAGTKVAVGDAVAGGEREIAIGRPGSSGDNGSVLVISPVYELNTSSLVSLFFGNSSAPIGESLAFVGDRDGDGLDDVALGSPDADVGAPFGIADAGTVTFRSGATGAFLGSLSGTSAFDAFGTSVAGADLDGDGSAELIVGVPGDSDGVLGGGAAWFYRGSSCPATSELYGSGLAGTSGIPSLSSSPPILGDSLTISLTNSLGAPTTAWFFLGAAATSVPFKGGTLLVDAFATFPVPIGTSPLTLAGDIPDDATFCGVSLFLQALLIDGGAPNNVAFSRGLELKLGT